MAGHDDVAALAALRSDSTGDGRATPEFAHRLGAWLAAQGDHRTTWLAEVDQAPVGMISLLEYVRMPTPGRHDSVWGYVGNLFVVADHRRRGIGTMLLRRLIDHAHGRGHVRLVVSPSARAEPLFRRAGFGEPSRGTAGFAAPMLVRPLLGAAGSPAR